MEKTLKRYYSISEVAKIVGVTDSTLRYWEKEFGTLRPKTVGNKVRQYREGDIKEAKLIYNLVKERGFKIEAAKKILNSNNRKAREDSQKIIEHLKEVRQQLVELKEALMKIV